MCPPDNCAARVDEPRADGTQTLCTYEACDAACPANGVYRIFTQILGGGVQSAPTSVVYFDRLNREVRALATPFSRFERLTKFG